MKRRLAEIRRVTKETRILVQLNLDGHGQASVSTGIPFFDHMLDLFARHAVMDLDLRCRGDLDVDAHHTVEDCGVALGQAFLKALGNKKGLRRYGYGLNQEPPMFGEFYVPMDECLSRCVVDFCGRPCLIWRGLDQLAFKKISLTEKNQDMACSFRFGLAREFFQALASEAKCSLHVELLYGGEPHHVVESIFKAFAKAVYVACQRDLRISGILPSTKGAL
jgi:imidazoleglycerol-phosphate dehydratase